MIVSGKVADGKIKRGKKPMSHAGTLVMAGKITPTQHNKVETNEVPRGTRRHHVAPLPSADKRIEVGDSIEAYKKKQTAPTE